MSAWIDSTVSVDELKLDLENPRLPKYVKDVADENKIRDYLLNKEHVTKIARSISANGYHHSAVSITYQDKDGKYIVLDGNRRLAACQLLSSPGLAADAKNQKVYEGLAKDMPANTLNDIKITIAPSRKEAEKEIWDIHVSPTAKPWEVLQKLRMYRNLIDTGDYNVASASHEYGRTETAFKKELAKLYLYERIDERVDDKGQEELLNSGFNKIERILMSGNGKKLLDFEVESDGKISIKDSAKFDSNLAKLIPYVVEPNRVTAQVTQPELIRDVYSKIDSSLFPSESTQPTVSKVAPKTVTPTKPAAGTTQNTLSKSDWVTEAEYRAYSGEERVKNILEELKKNKPTKGQNLNIVSIAMRIAIELAIYAVLKQKGHITTIVSREKARIKAENTARTAKGAALIPGIKKDWTPTLNEMLDFMLDEANRVVTDPQERRALLAIKNKRNTYMSDLNSFIHNVSFKPTESDTRDLWDTFGRQIFDIIKKI